MENSVLATEKPKVGIGVLVINDGKLLLGERIYSHCSGTWCPPGGHLEFGETPSQCAARELEEETGLIATTIIPGPWSNDFFERENKHYVTLFMFVTAFEGKLRVTEPEKCASWQWFDFDKLPQPLFLSLSQLLETHSLDYLSRSVCLK